MKVLHLFSNYKWTGPAEPALNLCLALREIGVEVDFACGLAPPHVQNKIAQTARERGIEPIEQLRLSKHRHPLYNWIDRRTLSRLLRERPFDVVHCHLDNDHRIAAAPAAHNDIPLIRSSYYGEGLPDHAISRAILSATAFLIEPARLALEKDARNFQFPSDQIQVIPGAVDTRRFDPARPLPDARARLNIPQNAFVIGIVARMQRHRHYQDLWDAASQIIAQRPNVHILVVGRGTYQEDVANLPVQTLGLEQHVHFSGYVDGDEYLAMLKAFDVKVFLVPGSDGTCRAVREAMAMGKPAVVARRGMLPEIVDHGVNGLVFDNSADSLAQALLALITDRARLEQFARAARQKAEQEYALPVQAQRVIELYERCLSRRNVGTP